jgi:hypothetical protein
MRNARALLLAAAVTTVACFELSGPADGVAAISELVSPSPAVAVGDVMRDENAQPAPLRLVALDADGDTVRDVAATFVVLDRGATVTQAGLVSGDSVRSTPVRITASIGGLQAQPISIRVVPAPTAVRDTVGATLDTNAVRYPAPGPQDVVLPALGFQVVSGATPVPSWPVRFTLATSVVSVSETSPAVRLVKRGTRTRATIDTTDASGYGLLSVQILPINIANVSLARVDTVRVTASTVIGVGATARRVERTFRLLVSVQQ